MNAQRVGLFGKLPAHGDFVMRDLPSGFVNAWDEWLQHYVAGSKEQLGENWLNIYLTSPIWRFVFTDGVIDSTCWAGVMLPSVDRVGRYYPVSAVMPLADDVTPLEFISMQSDWYMAIEELMLQSLEGAMDIDELSERVNSLEYGQSSMYARNMERADVGSGMQISMEFEEQMPVSVYPYLFDSVLRNMYPSYSVWSTTGSEFVEPSLFLNQGMPQVSGLPAMMDGQWQQWGWQQPYKLLDLEVVEQV